MMEMKENFLYEVFSDLQKSFGSLNREHCMKIIVRYGLGPWVERLLFQYC